MKTYGIVWIVMIAGLVILLTVAFILQSEDFGIPLIAYLILIFLLDTWYLINERREIKNEKKYIFPKLDKSNRKFSNYGLIVFGLIIISYSYYKHGFDTVSIFMFGVFVLLGIRGLLFGEQTYDAIRIGHEYIEYGQGLFSNVKISSVKSYSIDYDTKVLILGKEKKDIRINLENYRDIEKMDALLKEKIGTSA
jgi:hypothetical protein